MSTQGQPASPPLQSQAARWGVYYTTDHPTDPSPTYRLARDYDSYEMALEGSQAYADHENARNRQWGGTVWGEPSRGIHTIMDSANITKMRFEVRPIYDNPFHGLQLSQKFDPQLTAGAVGEKQDTPVFSDSAKTASYDIQESKEAAYQSPFGLGIYSQAHTRRGTLQPKFHPASTPHHRSYPTPGPDDRTLPSDGAQAGTHSASIETLSQDLDMCVDRDAIVDDIDGAFGYNNIDVEDASVTPQELTPEQMATAEASSAFQESANVQEPATIQESSEKQSIPGNTPVGPGTEGSSTHFGLYIIMPNPESSSPRTYCVQVNTSLGQAQSDMRLIAGNVLPEKVRDGVHVELNKNSIEIRPTMTGSRLRYEVHKGQFVDGHFLSEMEISGRATPGESYTREKMKEKHAAKGTQEGTVAEATTPEAEPSRKRTRSPEGEVEPEINLNEDLKEKDDPVTQPPKKRKVAATKNARDKNVVQNEEPIQEEKPAKQDGKQKIRKATPVLSKKRRREVDEPMEEQRGEEDKALIKSPSKKLKTGSAKDAEGQEADVLDGEETAVARSDNEEDEVFCRCKQPDDGSKMYGCNGPDCPNNGWVHLKCVKVRTAPKDNDKEPWFCPDCAKGTARKKQKLGTAAAMKKNGASKKGGTAASKKRKAR